MELWIRSQDRTALIKIDELNIGKSGSFWVIKDKNPKNILGSYDSFDRTLEVLDEIQNKMLNGAFAKKINGLGEELDLIPNPILIYQMPEK